MVALLVLMLTSLEIFFEWKRMFEEELYFGCKVIKNSSNIYIFLTLGANRNLVKKDIFQKLMIK